MKIKIANDLWKVKLKDGDSKKMHPSKDRINLGLTEYTELVINIRKEMPLSLARSTVIHELVHAFIFSYGYEMDSEEAMCNFFGVHANEILELTEQIMKGVIDVANNRRN